MKRAVSVGAVVHEHEPDLVDLDSGMRRRQGAVIVTGGDIAPCPGSRSSMGSPRRGPTVDGSRLWSRGYRCPAAMVRRRRSARAAWAESCGSSRRRGPSGGDDQQAEVEAWSTAVSEASSMGSTAHWRADDARGSDRPARASRSGHVLSHRPGAARLDGVEHDPAAGPPRGDGCIEPRSVMTSDDRRGRLAVGVHRVATASRSAPIGSMTWLCKRWASMASNESWTSAMMTRSLSPITL